jgi:hypothetical protein
VSACNRLFTKLKSWVYTVPLLMLPFVRCRAQHLRTATGLKPGTYRLVLDKNTTEPRAGTPSGCATAFGPALKAPGKITEQLARNSAAGPIEAYLTTSPGSSRLEIGRCQVPISQSSFVARPIHLMR